MVLAAPFQPLFIDDISISKTKGALVSALMWHVAVKIYMVEDLKQAFEFITPSGRRIKTGGLHHKS
jgi:hypothetical protein